MVFASSGPAAAQSVDPRLADASITATISPVGPLFPGSVARIALVFSNRGPDALPGLVAIGTPLPLPPFNDFIVVPDNQLTRCELWYDFIEPAPDRRPLAVPIVSAGPLASGEVKTCFIQVVTESYGSGDHTLVFGLFDGDVPWNDPLPGDNAAVVFFSIAFPAPVRVPAQGMLGLLAVFVGMVALGGWRLRTGA
jgi:hypothetical protein